jgi:hypothetical protein
MFWRIADPILDENGDVETGGMWPHQRQWWQSPHYIKALVTGYGGGKTFQGGKRSISLTLHNYGSPHLIVSPSYKVAKRTIIPTLDELLDGAKIRHKFNKTDHEYILNDEGNPGKIWIASGDEPKSLKGPNVGSALIDEPFIQDRAVFDQVMARVRDPKARHREIGLTGTPEELNWGYDISDGDEKQNFDIELIQASTRANKALPQQYIDSLESGYDDLAVKAFVEGQFVSLKAGLVYHVYDVNLNSTQMVINEDRLIIIGMDFNVDPMTAVLCHEIDGRLYACEEVILPNSDTETLCRQITQLYPKGRFLLYPDSSGKDRSSRGRTDFAIAAETLGSNLESIEYPAKNPYLRDRFNSVNALCKNAKGERRFFVNRAQCPELDRDLIRINHPYEEYKKKNQKRTHASDAVGYIISRRYEIGERSKIIVN